MAENKQRRLAAIVLADVVGYSRLMGADETGTLDAMRAHRQELWDPSIERYDGRVVNRAGDSALIEFASAVAAMECSVDIQNAMVERNAGLPEDKRILLRIGVNVGEVVVDGEEIFGDGVNVAARLQTLANPGGIALSGNVHENIANRLDLPLTDDGDHMVKNIARPIRVWQWSPVSPSEPATTAAAGDGAALALPDKPSIAVLPFDNLSGDSEQAYFADGMAEDIITGLSKFNWLFVIARNSSFTYKGQAVDVRAVARDLGVRYVLEGSVRRGGPRIRVTGQLIDAETGNHLWAERYDRPLDDIFEVQDEVTSAIVAAIAPEIGQAEIERAKRKPPENLDAWALYQRALEFYPSGDAADWEQAMRLFDQARAADPTFVDALVMAAHMRTRYVFFFEPPNRDDLLREAGSLLKQAMRLDPGHSMCHAATARLQVVIGEPEHAETRGRDAVALNPNSALAHQEFGLALMHTGHSEEALREFDIVLRLSPRDPHRAGVLAGKAYALFGLGRDEECVETARECSRSANPRYWNDAILVAALHRLDRHDEMEEAKRLLMSRRPDFALSTFRVLAATTPTLRQTLREAGLPD